MFSLPRGAKYLNSPLNWPIYMYTLDDFPTGLISVMIHSGNCTGVFAVTTCARKHHCPPHAGLQLRTRQLSLSDCTGNTFWRSYKWIRASLFAVWLSHRFWPTSNQGRIKLFGAPRQWKHFRPLFQAVFLSGGGHYPPRLSQTPRLPVPRQK